MTESKKEVRQLQQVMAKIRVFITACNDVQSPTIGFFKPASRRLKMRVREELKNELDYTQKGLPKIGERTVQA